MVTTSRFSSKKQLLLVGFIALAWPPVYSLFVYPQLAPRIDPSQMSASDLQRLLGAHRYTLHIPAEHDGWYLSLESVVDGVADRNGGGTVFGDREITLLVRRVQDTRKIEYCYFTDGLSGRGVSDDPIAMTGTVSYRPPGIIRSGDWLFRGGRSSLNGDPDAAADFEVHAVLYPPNDDGVS